MRKARVLLLATSSACIATLANAQETATYSYDPLGRLVSTSISGGPNNTRAIAACFDAAGNRTQYTIGSGTPTTCTPTSTPTPSPTPTPTPTPTPNQSPVAVNDSASAGKCQEFFVDVVANDHDPDNNVPLTLVSITHVSGSGSSASVASATQVDVITSNPTGIAVYNYVIQDSLGATATGQLTVTNTGGICEL
jgi:YD repeat-containing protein